MKSSWAYLLLAKKIFLEKANILNFYPVGSKITLRPGPLFIADGVGSWSIIVLFVPINMKHLNMTRNIIF